MINPSTDTRLKSVLAAERLPVALSLTAGGLEPLHTFAREPVQSWDPKPLSAQLQIGALLITVGAGAGFASGSAAGLGLGLATTGGVGLPSGSLTTPEGGAVAGEGGAGVGVAGGGGVCAGWLLHAVPMPVFWVLAPRPLGR